MKTEKEKIIEEFTRMNLTFTVGEGVVEKLSKIQNFLFKSLDTFEEKIREEERKAIRKKIFQELDKITDMNEYRKSGLFIALDLVKDKQFN